jgi:hypothetical protein
MRCHNWAGSGWIILLEHREVHVIRRHHNGDMAVPVAPSSTPDEQGAGGRRIKRTIAQINGLLFALAHSMARPVHWPVFTGFVPTSPFKRY